MAETFKYFAFETTNLRSEYGGGAIQTFGDSSEITGLTLTIRHLLRKFNYPKTGTHYLFQTGTVAGVLWAKVSDNLYTAISPYLSASELASVTSTQPGGYTVANTMPKFNPRVGKRNILVIGDSISQGVSTTLGVPDSPSVQAGKIKDSTLTVNNEAADRVWEGKNWVVCNMAIGGGSFANTNGAGGSTGYPYTLLSAFDQRYRTLPLNTTEKVMLHVWLGTNDLKYDTGQTAASVWARLQTYIGALRTEFPSLPIVIGTLIRRSEDGVLNGKIVTFNNTLRTSYAAVGATDYVDYSAAHPSFDPSTGNSADPTVYAGDGVHVSTVGANYLALKLAEKMTI